MRTLRSKVQISFPASGRVLALVLIAGLGFSGSVWSQRAEQEAEQQVAFSADTIIGLLRTEPGLFLQVKRLLVQKAYEQGRILDPSDLIDEAVFRLLRADNTIRILATREIEMRSYIRPKPTRQELEHDPSLSPPPPVDNQASPLPSQAPTAPKRDQRLEPGVGQACSAAALALPVPRPGNEVTQAGRVAHSA
jgi:hypothetical protein